MTNVQDIDVATSPFIPLQRGTCLASISVRWGWFLALPGTEFRGRCSVPEIAGEIPTRSTAGYSLLELTTAIALMIAVFFGAIQVFHSGVDTVKAIHERDIALRAARNEIETRRVQPQAEGKDLPFLSVTPELARLVRAEAVVEVAPSPVASLKTVIARIEWRTQNGRKAHVELTAVAPGGGQ